MIFTLFTRQCWKPQKIILDFSASPLYNGFIKDREMLKFLKKLFKPKPQPKEIKMAEFTQELRDEMVAAQPLDFEKAKELAAKHDVKARSIVASATRQGLEYRRKERVSKAGKKVVSKADLVAKIAEKHGVTVEDLEGLDKASKSALEVLC